MKNRRWSLVAILMVMALVAAACGRGDEEGGDSGGGEAAKKGGILKVGLLDDVTAAFDPQKEYYSTAWEFFRCCLARTMLTYNGMSAEEGGNDLEPDLAESWEVSDDGLTYTFKLKQGVKYGPPLEDVEVTAQDFVRALEREADGQLSAGGYNFYYSVIEGFDDFGAGKADSISGLTAVDDYTLTIKVSQPAGELPYLLAMPAAAPIPPNPNDPDARLGIAQEHPKDFGRYLVSTGPYMFEGSENLDFTGPGKDQTPVSGYEPGRSIVLVRNPSWTNDDIRPAYVDRIEVQIGGTEQDLANKVELGEIDFSMDGGATPDEIKKYSTDPNLKGRLFANADDAVAYISLNIAEPPFDDVHVRKAVNYVVNRDAMLRIAGGPMQGHPASHIIPPAVIGNLNADYDPFATPGNQGDVDKAKEEMKLSKYDSDGNGVCDDPSCEAVLNLSLEEASAQDRVELVSDAVSQIGIVIDNKALEIGPMYNKCNDPAEHVAICTNVGWGKDFPDGITYGPPLFGSVALNPACCNYSLVGASPEQLEKWGYSVTEVPSVDADMDACAAKTGDERTQCWADVDRKLSEEVVPWATVRFTNYTVTVSANVSKYTFDQFAGQPSLDHIAVSGASGAV